jgi:hypothetical protein
MLKTVIFTNMVLFSCFALNKFLKTKASGDKVSSIDPKKELEMILSKLSDLENKIEDQEKSIKKLLSSD